MLLQKLRAHRHYSGQAYELSYWRTTSGFEVDYILGDGEVALEIKAAATVQAQHLRGLWAWLDEHTTRRAICVSLDPRPRQVDAITILPLQQFLDELWNGRII